MDTDVKVYKSFDEFLHWGFFSSVEFHPNAFKNVGIKQLDSNFYPIKEGDVINGLGILAACCAAEKGNPFIKECMDFFGQRHFIKEDGSLFVDIINPGIMATIATKYGFRYKDENQQLSNNMMIYNSSIFAGNPATRNKDSYCMHFCDGSWKERTLKQEIKYYIKKYIIKHK